MRAVRRYAVRRTVGGRAVGGRPVGAEAVAERAVEARAHTAVVDGGGRRCRAADASGAGSRCAGRCGRVGGAAPRRRRGADRHAHRQRDVHNDRLRTARPGFRPPRIGCRRARPRCGLPPPAAARRATRPADAPRRAAASRPATGALWRRARDAVGRAAVPLSTERRALERSMNAHFSRMRSHNDHTSVPASSCHGTSGVGPHAGARCSESVSGRRRSPGSSGRARPTGWCACRATACRRRRRDTRAGS